MSAFSAYWKNWASNWGWTLYTRIRFDWQKSLVPAGLPFGVVAMDGKTTSLKESQEGFTQDRGGTHVIQTITSALTSAATKPCTDTSLLPPTTNESGHFKTAFDNLLQIYGTNFFQLVTYDAGAISLENASWVNAFDKSYLFSLKDNQPNLFALAKKYLNNESSRTLLHTQKEKVGGKIVTNTVYGCASKILIRKSGWSHLTQVLKVERQVANASGILRSEGCRYFVTNLDSSKLNGCQIYRVIRSHWAVENNCHCVFDKSFKEDARHWIESPVGNLNILILRRLVYNLLGHFRTRTQRVDLHKRIGWKELFFQIQTNFLQLSEAVCERLCVHNRGSPQIA